MLNPKPIRPKKLSPYQIAQNVEPAAEVIIGCEADEQWSYVRCKGNQHWLFYAYDHIRKRLPAHAFGPRNALTLQSLLVLPSQFKSAFCMTDARPVYRTLLASTGHVISKKYTQRIERHNFNLRTHLKRLTRKTICFSKSEEMHDNVSYQSDIYIITPQVTVTQPCQCQVNIQTVREGAGGSSNIQQRKKLSLPVNQPIDVSRMQLTISQNDTVKVVVTLTDGQSLHLTAQWPTAERTWWKINFMNGLVGINS